MKHEIEINDFIWTLNTPITHCDIGFYDNPIPDNVVLTSIKRMMTETFYNLARPVLRSHGGDLYHDIHFINEILKPENANGFSVFYGVRQYGTHLQVATIPLYIAEHNDFTYKITVNHDGKRWSVVSELISCHG